MLWFDGIRQPNTLYVASVSRGKDSTAMLRAIQLMGWPLDAITSVDVWATQDIPAELPPMVAFKDEWDKKCLEMTGIPVTRISAKSKDGCKLSYDDLLHKTVLQETLAKRKLNPNFRNTGISNIRGFPARKGSYCTGELKQSVQKNFFRKTGSNVMFYLGIALDETIRVNRHIEKPDAILPLVQIGWDEALCGLEAQYMGMLAPTYKTGERDGCWFCHNQSLDHLRRLRHDYPDRWALLMKWDLDSPVTFHSDGHTVHDLDRRFELEDAHMVPSDRTFRWSMLDKPKQVKFF